jgi:uncharacterized protein with PIN domain
VIPVADSSVLLAILLGEAERAQFKRFLLAHEVKISAGTLIETLRVVQLALGPEALSGVDALMRRAPPKSSRLTPIKLSRREKACFASGRAVAKSRQC